jgi:uncharacterized protein YyaL (SSP411 family)
MGDAASFHFSPRANRAHEIRWREWGEDAFEAARSEGKPVLLALSAVWCHWCHVMDETTYSDEGVITFINERFVPVRVDNDQRPDINARYNMGGWPTTAFLTPDGETLAGGTYIAPDQMKDVLPKVYTHFVGNREEIDQKAAEMREERQGLYTQGAGPLDDAALKDVLKAVMNNYDPLYGGLGEAPKFPHTDAIGLLLYAHRRDGDPDPLHMARKTLEMMYAGEVYDREWNGFFRYATRRDWSEPHYEKMLEDEAGLLQNALGLFRITREAAHREIAEGIIAYVEWKLRDEEAGYFYGSQDADEEFYALDSEGRRDRQEPYIDRTCYTSWNAQMISAYLEASWTLDRPELAERAAQALNYLWDRLQRDGMMHRYVDEKGEPQVPGLLADQARTAVALLDAYEVTAEPEWLERAEQVAGVLTEHFVDTETGGVWDTWASGGPGRLGERQKSIPENAVCAEVFRRLGAMTREERHTETARRTLEAFAGLYSRMGHFAAGYAMQADMVLNPPAEINIIGKLPEAGALHRAALDLAAPGRTVQVMDPERDSARLAALGLPAEPSPAAYVCAGKACSAPVQDPKQLQAEVGKLKEAAGDVRI